MSIYYSEQTFVIDLIRDAYKTDDVDLIRTKAKEDLATELSRAEIHDYLNHSEDYEIASRSISMREHFKEYDEC